jgi:hypothetical protein
MDSFTYVDDTMDRTEARQVRGQDPIRDSKKLNREIAEPAREQLNVSSWHKAALSRA